MKQILQKSALCICATYAIVMCLICDACQEEFPLVSEKICKHISLSTIACYLQNCGALFFKSVTKPIYTKQT